MANEFTPLPTPPSTLDPVNFNSRADAFLGALPTFQEELNDYSAALTNMATDSTSTTSNTIGLGAKTFTVQTGKSYYAGMTVQAASTSSPTNWMIGTVTSYNSGTGALTINVTTKNGTATYASWNLFLSLTLGDSPIGFNELSTDVITGAPELTIVDGTTDYLLIYDASGTSLNKVKSDNLSAGAKGGQTDKVFWENDTTINYSYTITAGKNAGSYGPITIAPSAIVTVPSGSRWVVI